MLQGTEVTLAHTPSALGMFIDMSEYSAGVPYLGIGGNKIPVEDKERSV